MSVITLANSKGGSSRTTVARCIAGALARDGAEFAVVDSDPTSAFHRWATTIYEGPPFRSILETNEDKLAHLIAELRSEYAFVLVDTAGFANLSASVAIASADAVLIPLKVSEPDLFEARTTARRVASLGVTTRRQIEARVLLSSARSTAVALHAGKEIEAMGMKRLKTRLGHRAEYEAMSYTGRAPVSGPAYHETTSLIIELRELGWMPIRTDRKANVCRLV